MIPTIEEIRKLCTESSFERGIEYFRQGSITGLEEFGNRITATVAGTNDYEVTIRIDKEGLGLFPEHLTKEIRRFLNRFYEKHSPERYKQNLIALFTQGRDWNDYERLKELCSKKEWEKAFSLIINALSGDRLSGNDTIISIYLREGMLEQALKHVLARRSLFTLNMYYEDLWERFPRRYFDGYKELLIPFADSKMGRAHYREIVKYLKQMKRIKGLEEEFRRLVQLLKAKYANRPAFLDEIKGM